MNIYLIGHDYKYAAEQMLLSLYPEERPLYPEGETAGDSVALKMTYGETYATCVCRLRLGGAEYSARAAVEKAKLQDKLTTDRHLQHIVKLAFYRAALAAGHEVPAWGSLTGVRPGKLFVSLMRQGLSETQAAESFRRDYDVSPERTALCRQTVRAALSAKATLQEKDACLYIDIPFCPTRCAYCSFISVEAGASLKLMPEYLAALRQEMESLAGVIKRNGVNIVAVYFGGGTPTTLSARQLDELLCTMEEFFDLSACREITVEAGRPDTVTEEKLQVLLRHRVDRVNVNPQTMNDAVLQTIGRHHTAEDIRRAYAMVRAAGRFDVNMDLIAGLPGDTPESFAATIREVVAMRPENITVHTLSLKKGSRFLSEKTILPDGEDVRQMLNAAKSALESAGYVPYYLYRAKFMSGSFENVGWTLPGHDNLYNICIMEELTPILAAGCGGSTKLVTPGGAVQRMAAPKYPREYIARIESTCAAKTAIDAYYQSLYAEKEE